MTSDLKNPRKNQQAHSPKTRVFILSALCLALLPLAGCNKNNATDQNTPATTAASAPAATPYVPLTADQLYQLVSPIALFPDKLVAQVLAGSTYPSEVTAANTWIGQNPTLTGAPLQTAVDQQPWDPSIKGLMTFPNVLNQMAQNIQWTTALGQAYANDPTDVMNAIQVMRQRAASHGTLKSNKQLHITQKTISQPANYAGSGAYVIPPPTETYEIAPADPDLVYVPQYNPQVVYGDGYGQVYPGYSYQPPPPPPQYDSGYNSGYNAGDVAAGAITFGVGIAVLAAMNHHHEGGWNSWGMHWGGSPDRGNDNRGYGHQDNGYRGPHPAVIYNNQTYVSRSNTVVNQVTDINNVRNNTTINQNNYGNPNGGPDHNPRPNEGASPNFAGPNAGQNPNPPHAGNPNGQPDFNTMNRPHFGPDWNSHTPDQRPSSPPANGNPPQQTPPNAGPSPEQHSGQDPGMMVAGGAAALGAGALMTAPHFDHHDNPNQNRNTPNNAVNPTPNNTPNPANSANHTAPNNNAPNPAPTNGSPNTDNHPAHQGFQRPEMTGNPANPAASAWQNQHQEHPNPAQTQPNTPQANTPQANAVQPWQHHDEHGDRPQFDHQQSNGTPQQPEHLQAPQQPQQHDFHPQPQAQQQEHLPAIPHEQTQPPAFHPQQEFHPQAPAQTPRPQFQPPQTHPQPAAPAQPKPPQQHPQNPQHGDGHPHDNKDDQPH